MFKLISAAPKTTLLVCAIAAWLGLPALAQPGPAQPVTAPPAKPALSTGAATPAPGPFSFGQSIPTLPPMLEGVISLEEYRKYTAFQQALSEDPAIKSLNAKVLDLTKEMQRLRMEMNVLREKMIAANPEISAIQDKIMTKMRLRAGSGPTPMPMSMPVKRN